MNLKTDRYVDKERLKSRRERTRPPKKDITQRDKDLDHAKSHGWRRAENRQQLTTLQAPYGAEKAERVKAFERMKKTAAIRRDLIDLIFLILSSANSLMNSSQPLWLMNLAVSLVAGKRKTAMA